MIHSIAHTQSSLLNCHKVKSWLWGALRSSETKRQRKRERKREKGGDHPEFELSCDVTVDDGCAAVNLGGDILKWPQPPPLLLPSLPRSLSISFFSSPHAGAIYLFHTLSCFFCSKNLNLPQSNLMQALILPLSPLFSFLFPLSCCQLVHASLPLLSSSPASLLSSKATALTYTQTH